mgnify:CR=1 FL=1
MSKTILVRRLALTCYLALGALLLAWLTWLAPPPRALISLSLLVFLLPWSLALRGLLHGRRYTFAWTTLLILLYFAHGVAACVGPGLQRWLGAAEIALSLGYFALAIAYVRLSGAPAKTTEDDG